MNIQHLQHLKWLLISIIVLVGFNSATDPKDNTSGVKDLELYAPTPLTESSSIFSVRAKTQSLPSWQSIPVDFFESVHYARLSGSGTLTFEITAPDRIDNCTISPKRLGIQRDINGNKVVFSVTTQPRHLAVKINDLRYLFLLIDPLETDDPTPTQRNVVNVRDYVTDATGTSDQTENLQKAIDQLYTTKSKNVLLFPSGIYKFRTLYFLNRTKPVTIYIEDGALLTKALRQSSSEEETTIKIVSSKNILIKGRGVIDCNAKANLERWDIINEGSPFPFWIMDGENISIMDILMRNSGEWSTHVHYCRNFTLSNYKVINPWESGPYFTDGINISCGDKVLVENCFVYCNDDIFATGQHEYEVKRKVNPVYMVMAADTKNFIIRNLTGVTLCSNMMRFGCQSMGYSVKNYRFENCDFILDADALSIARKSRGGASVNFFQLKGGIKPNSIRKDGVYDNISFVNCSWENDNNRDNIRFSGDVTFGKLELINCTFDYTKGAELSNIEEFNVQGFKSGGKVRKTPAEAGFALHNVKQVNWSGTISK